MNKIFSFALLLCSNSKISKNIANIRSVTLGSSSVPATVVRRLELFELRK